MRKYVSIVITTLFLFAFGFAEAQGYTFRVLVNKGQNKVKKAGASTALQLKTGTVLNTNDRLIASKGAYIGLMHKTGKTLEVTTSGTKKVSDLEKEVSTKTTSVASRYAKFLANKMNEKEKPGYRANLSKATGAAERGFSGDIKVLLPSDPEQSVTIEDKVIVTWETKEDIDVDAFIVTVYNIFDEEILKEEVQGNSLDLDFTQDKMQNEEGLYIIKVLAKTDKESTSGDEGIPIRRLTEEEAAQYKEGLESLKSEMSGDSPLDKLIYASYYEEKGLIVDALTIIEEAIRMNPDIEDFVIFKQDIIERNSIKIYKEEPID
ncbi:MAG: hypothetical protein AAF620_10680 [Bacteroidota bacterium]